MLMLLTLAVCLPAYGDNKAILLHIDGAIGPASRDYIQRSMDKANQERAELIILRMDTPGGLDFSMRDIIQDILVSPIPIVGYVAPPGARAASAGTYLLYASHFAAMSPATNLGAATPVQIGGLPKPPSPDNIKKPLDTDSGDTDSAMKNKIINDSVAYLRSLAKLRGRNEEWAVKAVRDGASIPAEEALSLGVIDIVADDIVDLLSQLDGRTISIMGQEKVLDTSNMLIIPVAQDWRNQLLAIITDPNIAYILMLLGIYGLIFELSNPGALIPGITGAICLLLAMYAFQMLPVNYAGMGLVLLGIALMVAEAFAPSFGILGLGGVLAFILGSVILIDTDLPGYGIALPLIGGFGVISSLAFTFILVFALKARKKPVVCGPEALLNSYGEVIIDFESEGKVKAHSETWSARTTTPLTKGQRVRIVKLDGLTLWVEPDTSQKQGE